MAAARWSAIKAQRSSLRRLLLADCACLAGSALCSLSGHAELESLDLSRSIQALSDVSITALQQINGDPSSTCPAVPGTLEGSCGALEDT